MFRRTLGKLAVVRIGCPLTVAVFFAAQVLGLIQFGLPPRACARRGQLPVH
jgi:hypothetical protein